MSGIFLLTELWKIKLPGRSQLQQERSRWLTRFPSCAALIIRVPVGKKIMNRDTVDASKSSVELNDTDIPGAHLDEPLEAHNVAALRWWLLCRGIKVTTSLRKRQIIAR